MEAEVSNIETQVFRMDNPRAKYFIWAGAISFVLFILFQILNKEAFPNTISNYYFLIWSILSIAQYFVYKSWYIKINQEALFIRRIEFPIKILYKDIKILYKDIKVLYKDIKSHKVLVTGDIEIKLENKEIEISKDLLKENDFENIKRILNNINQ